MEDFQPRVATPTQPEAGSTHEHEQNDAGYDAGGTMLESYEIAQLVGANMQDYQDADIINGLTSEIRKLGFQGTDALVFIQNIQNRLAPPPIGVSYARHLYNYVKLMTKTTEITKLKRMYEQ